MIGPELQATVDALSPQERVELEGYLKVRALADDVAHQEKAVSAMAAVGTGATLGQNEVHELHQALSAKGL